MWMAKIESSELKNSPFICKGTLDECVDWLDKMSNKPWLKKVEYTHSLDEINLNLRNPEAKKERMRIALDAASKWKKFYEFADLIELYWVALINERNFDANKKQLAQVSKVSENVLSLLRFARIGLVKKYLDNFEPDEVLFFKEDIDKIRMLINDFLEDN